MHKIPILMFLLVCAMSCTGQDVENIFGDGDDTTYTEEITDVQIVQPDTVLIKNATIVPADSILTLKKKKEFAYLPLMDSLLKAQSSQVDKKRRPSMSLLERFLNSAFFRFFIWLIPIILVVVVLYNFFKTQGTFARKKKTDVQEYMEDDVQNSTQDYLGLAREAAASGNYRPAVKFLFLRTLQQLDAGGLINYASDKTNYSYVQEIASDKKKEFARLVLNYEYVWYGNTIPKKATYDQIETDFFTFLRKYNLN